MTKAKAALSKGSLAGRSDVSGGSAARRGSAGAGRQAGKETSMASRKKPATAGGSSPDAGAAPSRKETVTVRRARYGVAHDIPGRMRLRPHPGARAAWLCPDDAAALEARLPGASVTVAPLTGSVLIVYADPAARAAIVLFFGLDGIQTSGNRASRRVSRPKPAREAAVSAVPVLPEERSVRNPLPDKILGMLFPRVVRFGLAIWRSLPYLITALKALMRGRLSLDVLDGAALLVCLLRRDFGAVASITFFFSLGEYLSDWTRKKSRASLAESLALNIDQVWVKSGDLERQIPLTDVRPGDLVVVRAGSAMPVDGTVSEGEGMVNQSSMTGEPLPVHKRPGDSVFAGTVLEQGELTVSAVKVGGDTRITAVLRSIEESEGVKAAIQSKYEGIADAIVPYNFLLSGMVYAATRDPMRAGSVLLVDYSCAIRLATPLTIFTAMREAADRGVLIKGGKFMEAAAEADVVVFDKTGTLTEAKPTLVDVIPFGGRSRDAMLRLAACLEEHFVHPVGQAVVRAAKAEGLGHREEHTEVEFMVAHGIASLWRGERVFIGSEHFVRDHAGVGLTREQQITITAESAKGRSVLYLAMGGELAAILLIEDKMREDAPAIVQALKRDGVRRVVMLTGDSELTARSIAARAGIDEVHASLLPEEKAAFVASLKREGHVVMMVGDGINDSPALSAADIGVAMADGADMAREVADMVLVNGELAGLLLARAISRAALHRVRANFHTSVFWNSVFLMGGLIGVLRPGISALMHNATTAAIAVRSLRPMLPEGSLLEQPRSSEAV